MAAGWVEIAPYYLDVGVVRTGGAPLPGTALLLAVLVELGLSEDGQALAVVLQSDGCAAVQLLLGFSADWQHDGHREVDGATWMEERCKSSRIETH